jgi:hypothetical protein
MATLSQDDVLEQVLATNPKVRAAQARVAARGEEVGVAGGALMPRVDLELRKRVYSDIKPDPVVESRDSAQVSLNYEMPLGGGNFSAKREAAARMAAAQADLDEARLEAETNSSQLWNVWSEARTISDSLDSRAAASDKVVAAYDQQFNAGRRSLQDLIAIRDEHQRTPGRRHRQPACAAARRDADPGLAGQAAREFERPSVGANSFAHGRLHPASGLSMRCANEFAPTDHGSARSKRSRTWSWRS